jgi:hypothetical protein
MSNSYRIRTQVGVDKSIKVNLEQDFEFLEILSLKILQSEIYTRQCADYGVVIGRISINGGFGLPNCKVSIFVPLADEDENNPIVSAIYPYKEVSDINDVGYRYNLLPYVQSYSNHVPTGSFFDKEDVLINQSFIQVFDKYYKYTANTNESGDFMIFGVPLGVQTIHVDVDLSDIGEFSLAPQDLIRLGLATEAQVSGTRFKSSSNLNELPQIISLNKIITVEPLWGQPDICNIGINRTDFDLSTEANVVIQPTAIFMGSMFSDVDNLALKSNCKPKFAQGELCSLVAGPGEILAIRQTIQEDVQGRPILEQYELEQNGQVIDENGTWLLDIPMNLDYVTTNEFGERVFSDDPKIGIPTRGKYRFKIKWNQSPDLNENVKRAYYLVPNVREYGWSTSNQVDPLQNLFPTDPNRILAEKSYAFSLDWDDYAEFETAINCEDTFYKFSYNKVYTVSQLIDQYRNGTLANRIISIKNILDNTCESINNKFPTNDTIMRFDFIFLLYYVASLVFRPILIALVLVIHAVYLIVNVLRYVLIPGLIAFCVGMIITIGVSALLGIFNGSFASFIIQIAVYVILITVLSIFLNQLLKIKLKGLRIPLLLYDLCEFCQCSDAEDITDNELEEELTTSVPPPPIAPPNVSGVQIVDLGYTVFYSENFESDTNYVNYSSLSQGYKINYPPSTPVCYSRVPQYVISSYTPPVGTFCTNSDDTPETSVYFTTSLTLAERINLFNTKAKYFEPTATNPNGGVNRISVEIEPNLNTNKIHYDNVICMLLTPESLSSLNIGTILTFVNPSNSDDINYNQAPLNVYGTNSITGGSQYTIVNNTISIDVKYTNPNNPQQLTTTYQIPIPNSADTNYHKFPMDIEYFQVITAMTITQYELSLANTNILGNNLWDRFINNDMSFNVLYKGRRNLQQTPFLENPLKGIENYGNYVVVFLSRGVDPYTTRVMTRYSLGRLFGYNNEDAVQVTGMTKLNIPIQGGFKNIDHSGLVNSSNLDSYSNMNLYYESYYYKPSQTDFSPFTSNNWTYYSSLKNNIPITYPCNSNQCVSHLISNNTTYGVKISSTNDFTIEWTQFSSPNLNGCERLARVNSIQNLQNRGYFPNEIVEGASVMSTEIQKTVDIVINQTYWVIRRTIDYSDPNNNPNRILQKSNYFAPKYNSGSTISYNLGNNNKQIVMRSDRLPTSDRLQENCNNFYSLQQNQNLGIYFIPDEGAAPIEEIAIYSFLSGDTIPPNFTAQILRTTNSCQESRNLSCYEFVPNGAISGGTFPGGGRFELKSPEDCSTFRRKTIFEKGCYIIVTRIIRSIPTDISLMTEWLSRTSISFAACRNVFSHLFTQNWVNGTLYSFAFKNNKIIDNNGKPRPKYCENIVFYDEKTNNFYYRSSPYTIGTPQTPIRGFVGKLAPTKPNENNLLYPTTIMDLGPRTDYLQELTFSEDFDGYVVKDIKDTSYQDVSELLNLLILTRLVNSTYVGVFIGDQGGDIFNYFTREPLLSSNQRRAVDGDYAQMISINSELGVVPFEAENYPNIDPNTIVPPLQPNEFAIDPVYFNTGKYKDVIFGVFYSSDTQIRDYISPKRTIISDNVLPNDSCAFNNFYCYSQEVPLYQWEIKNNSRSTSPNESIFGSQRNDWYTRPINGAFFFSKNYQSLDRANRNSRYFRTRTSPFAGDYKGYIYSIDTNPPATNPFYTEPTLNPVRSSWENNNPNDNSVTVGAPF